MPISARRAERSAALLLAAFVGLGAGTATAWASDCPSVRKLGPVEYWTVELVIGVTGERDEGGMRRGRFAGQAETCFEVPLQQLHSVDFRARGYLEGLSSFLESLPADPTAWKESPESLAYLQKASRVTGIEFVPPGAGPAEIDAGARRFQAWMQDNRRNLTWSAEAGRLVVDAEAGPEGHLTQAEEIDATTYWTYEALAVTSHVKDGPLERRGRYNVLSRAGVFRVPLAGLEDREAHFAGYYAAVEQLVLGLASQTGVDDSVRTFVVLRLQQITGETFEKPEQWMRWWVRNRAGLALSGDGKRLVVESR